MNPILRGLVALFLGLFALVVGFLLLAGPSRTCTRTEIPIPNSAPAVTDTCVDR